MNPEIRVGILQAKRAAVTSQLTRAAHGRLGLPIDERRRAKLERELVAIDTEIAELGGEQSLPPGSPPALPPRKDLDDEF